MIITLLLLYLQKIWDEISKDQSARLVKILGLRGAPKISVLRGSHCTVRVSIRELRISVRFVLYIALSKQQWWRFGLEIIFPWRLAIVNDIVSYL